MAALSPASKADRKLQMREVLDWMLEDGHIDAILHCAARSLVGESVRDPARYFADARRRAERELRNQAAWLFDGESHRESR